MYLTDALIWNSGAIEKLTLKAPFHSDGRPKPLLLVGANGSGKTSVLSIVADGLVEIAAQHFQNITRVDGIHRQYFRLTGGRSQRSGAAFELSVLRFDHSGKPIFFRSKAGSLKPADAISEMGFFQNGANWPENGNDKAVVVDTRDVAEIYDQGAYTFFPSSRFEVPYWANMGILERDPSADFTLGLAGQLRKPIIVQTAIQELKPWIIDVMLDMGLNSAEVFVLPTIEEVRAFAAHNATYSGAYVALTKIICAITKRADAKIVRLNRMFRDQRICVVYGNVIAIPSLDGLSAGQASLLSMFATIVRYGDTGTLPKRADQIEGIVLIDEADSHLHADLQHDSLPNLIKLFPRVQFIVTSHSPLFPLGMRRAFGDDGFTLLELPSGLTIDPERFSEFEVSFAYFRATQAFEQTLRTLFSASQRPLVLCEGETDPKYLYTAAGLIEFDTIAYSVDFDWVGTKSQRGARSGGKDALDSALKFLRNNPTLVQRRIVLLYDCDANRNPEDFGRLHIRSIPANPDNSKRKGGIENLLPEVVFEERFYRDEDISSGLDVGVVKKLQKVALCDYLCDEKRDPLDFEKFRTILDELRSLFLDAQDGHT